MVFHFLNMQYWWLSCPKYAILKYQQQDNHWIGWKTDLFDYTFWTSFFSSTDLRVRLLDTVPVDIDHRLRTSLKYRYTWFDHIFRQCLSTQAKKIIYIHFFFFFFWALNPHSFSPQKFVPIKLIKGQAVCCNNRKIC